ncbi:DUF4316 domain-containing protein [Ruminococcaceae bacterium OttesenSCG-928-A16]|nr:DUF4316 domain-containing protein [Ruminococcaceae bacterium OttesenSCG-928-A16]
MSILDVQLESGKNSTWLSLPVTAEQLNKALLDINALDKDYAITDCRTSLNLPIEQAVIGSDINMANYLAARLAELPQVQLDKMAAVMETPDALANIEQMIDFTYNTDFFVLIPDVSNTEDLARYYIFESGMVEMPSQWKDAIDLYAFGTNLEEQEKGLYTQKGYLLPSGDQWREVVEKTGIVPPEYRIDNYLKNAEISTEQNYNQIDGIINNEGQGRADLTDGQTHEEIMELAPETLQKSEKPSILGQLKKAQESIAKPDKTGEKKPPDLDL